MSYHRASPTDNEYYSELVGDPVLADAPDWTQMTVASSNAVQWTQGAGSPLLMLTVDIALARDLENNLLGVTATCDFRFPVANRCPLAETLTKAGVYRNNNDEWVKDFKRVLIVMVEKGLTSVLSSPLTPNPFLSSPLLHDTNEALFLSSP
jgi:hypothetical protein